MFDKIPYCETSAIGIGAPKCSEDCCDYGGCNKKAYFEHIAEKYNTTPDKIAIGTNFQFDKVVIEDREYSNEEVFEILKKHKEEEDKKKKTCFRCKAKYLKNEKFNMIDENLGPIYNSINSNKANYTCVVGYSSKPIISGIQIKSTCGDGAEICLCDKCINELNNWLKEK